MPAGPGARVVRERYALAQANWARFSLVCLSQRSRSLFARGGGAADLSERRARGFPGGVYDYNDSGAKVGVRPKLKKELATFLEQWLKNISDQGYDVKAAEERE